MKSNSETMDSYRIRNTPSSNSSYSGLKVVEKKLGFKGKAKWTKGKIGNYVNYQKGLSINRKNKSNNAPVLTDITQKCDISANSEYFTHFTSVDSSERSR